MLLGTTWCHHGPVAAAATTLAARDNICCWGQPGVTMVQLLLQLLHLQQETIYAAGDNLVSPWSSCCCSYYTCSRRQYMLLGTTWCHHGPVAAAATTLAAGDNI